jgi:hypothetical protein
MKRMLCAMLMIAIVLSGCGGAPEAALSTAPPIPTMVNAVSVAAGDFRADVTGAVTATLVGNAGVANNATGVGRMINLTSNDPTSVGKTIVLLLPQGAGIGTSPLVSQASAIDSTGNIIDFGASYSELTDGGGVAVFETITSGTLTITAVEPYTGTFIFTAESNGQSVTVLGAFSELPLF